MSFLHFAVPDMMNWHASVPTEYSTKTYIVPQAEGWGGQPNTTVHAEKLKLEATALYASYVAICTARDSHGQGLSLARLMTCNACVMWYS